MIKTKFEADYMITYHFCNGLSHLILSTDSDMAVLGGPSCLSTWLFTEENPAKKRKKGEKNSDVTWFIYWWWKQQTDWKTEKLFSFFITIKWDYIHSSSIIIARRNLLFSCGFYCYWCWLTCYPKRHSWYHYSIHLKRVEKNQRNRSIRGRQHRKV